MERAGSLVLCLVGTAVEMPVLATRWSSVARMSKPLGQARHHQDLFGLHGGAPVRSIKPLRQKAKAPAALCLIPQHGGTPRCVPVLIGRSGNAPVSSYQLRGLPSMKIGSATRAILAARIEFRTSFDMVEGTYFRPAAVPSGI